MPWNRAGSFSADYFGRRHPDEDGVDPASVGAGFLGVVNTPHHDHVAFFQVVDTVVEQKVEGVGVVDRRFGVGAVVDENPAVTGDASRAEDEGVDQLLVTAQGQRAPLCGRDELIGMVVLDGTAVC